MNNLLRLNRKNSVLAATMLASPLLMAAPVPCWAQIGISVQIAPPILQTYEQPPIPAEGYIWTPGYWAYQDAAYSWVPGAWVEPPSVGMLWTPPYWGWGGGGYLFHAGYWGTQVGYYGGVDYGFGYGGNGYEGGHWDGGHFAYNSRVNNFGGVHIANVYDRNVTVAHDSRVSFVGGAHGLPAAAGHADHVAVEPHSAEPAVRHAGPAARPEAVAMHREDERKPIHAAPERAARPEAVATRRDEEHKPIHAAPERAARPEAVAMRRDEEHKPIHAAPEHAVEHEGVARVGAEHEPPAQHAAVRNSEHPIEHAAPARVAYLDHHPSTYHAQHAVEHPPEPRAAAPEHAAPHEAAHAATPDHKEDKPR